MPNRPGVVCPCGGVKRDGVCDRCGTTKAKRGQAYDKARGPDRQWYGSTRWRKFREYVLRKRPACERCEAIGKLTVSKSLHLHHIKPRKTHPHLAYREDNVVVLCQGCHNQEKGAA